MSLTKLSGEDFTEMLASSAPVPGGGSASALAGAVGVALGNMVGSLTLGKKKYAQVEPDILALNEKAAALRARLLDLVDEDARAFAPLARAYGIPRDDPSRAEVMENALLLASGAPLEIMRACCEALDLLAEYAEKGSRLALSDAGVGAVICKAALQGASLNVFINTRSMLDRDRALALEKEADGMLRTYCPLADGIYERVTAALRG